jgi:hypothetical protein
MLPKKRKVLGLYNKPNERVAGLDFIKHFTDAEKFVPGEITQ